MRDKFRELYRVNGIPSGVYTISDGESVLDLPNMIGSHLAILDGDSDERIKRPYRLRLERLYKQLNK